MRFKTDYGPINISKDIGEEYKKIAKIPLASEDVNEVLSSLPNKNNSTMEEIEQGILRLANKISKGDDIVKEALRKHGGKFIIEPEGTIDVDENGELCAFLQKVT